MKLYTSLFYCLFLVTCLIFTSSDAFGQSTKEQISSLEAKKAELDKQKVELLGQLEDLRLIGIREDLKKVGLPKSNLTGDDNAIVEHSAMILSYNETHEQPNWVSHIVIPAVIEGNLSRTNDFRVDPKVTTKTAIKADYWYSGFDRGHIAPSADFRWSSKAISESYFYSNMAPQRPELNRERWAELEGWVRGHVYSTEEQMIVVAGGILKEGLPTIGKENKVSIPEKCFKVILDLEGPEKKAIGFILDNKECPYPVISYAMSVDEVEKITGLDFFSELDDELENKLESTFDTDLWQKTKEGEVADKAPMTSDERPKNTINSADAEYFIGQKTTVCGTIVSTKKTKGGSVFANLDQKFPNHNFSISVWASDIKNFSYSPEIEWMGQKVCVTGKITEHKEKATMNIPHERKIIFLNEEK
ncbi:MAG: DNA/RNA non-specific endonuclease [Aureispira sp.]|nr:DNA/RNA non-specific endonuclease [Aureispira sp.]